MSIWQRWIGNYMSRADRQDYSQAFDQVADNRWCPASFIRDVQQPFSAYFPMVSSAPGVPAKGFQIWGIDVAWCNPNTPYQLLVEHGARFGVCKLVHNETRDNLMAVHVHGITAAGMTLGGYYWGDPVNYRRVQQQADAVRRAIDDILTANLHLGRVISDREQWWADWTKYNKALRGEIPWTQVPVLPEAQVVDFYGELERRVGFERQSSYSAKWYADRYPSLPYFGWAASYFDYGMQPYSVTWDGFAGILAGRLTAPLLPVKHGGRFELWQFSSRIFLPGVPRIDLNVFNGGEDEYRTWFGLPQPSQPPTDEEKLNILWDAHPELHH